MKRVKEPICIGSESGASLIEVVIVFSMVTMAAFSILPLFLNVRDVSKTGQIQSLCQSVVRSKLEEYRFGRPVTVSEMRDSPLYLSRLSFPSFSTTTLGVAFKEQVNEEGEVVDPKFSGGSGGFFYSKWRYNRYFPDSCRGTSDAEILKKKSEDDRRFGFRECVGSNSIEDGTGVCKTLLADQRVEKELPGFKLYVKLERVNHWVFPSELWKKDATLAERFDESCPISNQGEFKQAGDGPLYDFNAAGDSVRVTVTGVVDFVSALSGRERLGAVSFEDTASLVCSASTVVAPAPFPFRYFRRSGEPILSWIGSSDEIEDNSQIPFKKMFGLPEPTENLDSIVGFSVHPLNASVTVLKAGSLIRFSRCGGVPLDCSTDPDDKGISDSGDAVEGAVQSFTLDAVTVSGIGVDYSQSPSRMFGFSAGFSDVSRILMKPGETTLQFVSLNQSLGSDEKVQRVFAPWIEWVKGNTGRPFLSGRVVSAFMEPSGEEVFISDKTNTSGTSSINFYRLGDMEMTVPVLKLPPGTVSFSK